MNLKLLAFSNWSWIRLECPISLFRNLSNLSTFPQFWKNPVPTESENIYLSSELVMEFHQDDSIVDIKSIKNLVNDMVFISVIDDSILRTVGGCFPWGTRLQFIAILVTDTSD